MSEKQFTRVSISKKSYGGNIYENLISRAFRFDESCRTIQIGDTFKGIFRFFHLPRFFYEVVCDYFSGNVFIINFLTLPLLPFVRGSIIVFHHVDVGNLKNISAFYELLAKFVFEKIVSRKNTIVVVASYWKEYVHALGFEKVYLIYNPFDIEFYDAITDGEVREFSIKYGLEGNTVVYIGNPQEKKGCRIVKEVLRGRDYSLVSTGIGVPLPGVSHLNLTRREYICLLKLSSCVVTFSQFKEGWCRVAHEALLCGTPVVGSGLGGMGELLITGGQLIARSPFEIPGRVSEAIANRSDLASSGIEYAREFTVERFVDSWRRLLNEI